MISDFRTAGEATRFETDVCVIGAGAAGIAVARSFIGSGHRVLLLEAGGYGPDADTQSLYEGSIIGQEYGPLDAERARWFGGTTNMWQGMCAPLQPIDFAARPWVKLSGWPIGRGDLDPFYAQAQTLLDLGGYEYDAAQGVPRVVRRHPFDRGRLVPEMWQFSHPPTNFGERYRPEIERAGNVTALLNANVTEIRLDASGRRVAGVEIGALDGRRAVVAARAFVLACGGLENPRLLLASTGVRPNGVGNDHDRVGRCFMEHPELRYPATGVLQGDLQWALAYRIVEDEAGYRLGHLRPSDAVQREQGILNTSLQVTLDLAPDPHAGYAALSRWRRGGGSFGDAAAALWDAVTDPDDVARGLYARVRDRQYLPPLREVPRIRITSRSEQAPNPDSRVVLTGERDALGMRRIGLDWRLAPIDKRTIRVGMELLAAELGRLGLGRLRLESWVSQEDETWSPDLEWGHHHMGTTRMSADPREGVVDADCAVHGVEGLYVAGSSVFPTGGYVNPTLSIVALALRLAEHLKGQLAA